VKKRNKRRSTEIPRLRPPLRMQMRLKRQVRVLRAVPAQPVIMGGKRIRKKIRKKEESDGNQPDAPYLKSQSLK
jgi:hypothetical protein